MASFDYPPLSPDPDPAPLSPSIPLNPPMVGEASPFEHVDGQNRDLILESIRAWIRTVLLAWTTAWQNYLVYWLALVETWLNGFITAAEEYITEYAVSGYSWRTTTTVLATTVGAYTTVVIDVPDQEHRPIEVGDLVSDESAAKTYGIITSVVDATHAVVETLGSLSGLPGHGWWTTSTPINASGTTNVTIAVDPTRPIQVGDFVSDESSALRYGQVTAIVDPTTVTVTPLGVLRGLAGFGWWTTTTPIAHTGTTVVTLATGPDRLPQINDLVVDETSSSAYGEITAIANPTTATVAYVGTLQGPPGVAEAGAFDYTTASLAPNAAYQGQMVGMPQMVGSYDLTVSAPAWIRVYASQSYLLADAGRPISTPLDISADHGCYLDFVGTLTELSKTLTPGIMFSDLGSGLWISITNTGTGAAEIAVHFAYRTFLE